MATMRWEKERRSALWRSGTRPYSGPPRPNLRPASEAQVIYLQDLLEKAGRRPLTVEEMAQLTTLGASRMIASLKTT